MATGRPFSGRVTIPDILAPAKSVGAHLAAKLESFASDERTLTDELCDMLCIWLSNARRTTLGWPDFTLNLRKTTAAVEVMTGADLELTISSPLGYKHCLLQAKVLDPTTGKLRCDSTQGWTKLQQQLSDARAFAGDLAFLLVYVPGDLLDGGNYGYSTYEQGFLPPTKGHLEAYRGATVIPVDDLLTPSNQWIDSVNKVGQPLPGRFHRGIPFWRFLLELMLCQRSNWQPDPPASSADNLPAFRSLSVGVSEVSEGTWREIQGMGADLLNDRDGDG